LFADVETRAPASAILATNTSSIRIEEIAAGLKNPSRLVGIHYFNPVASMPLVEVIRAEATDPQVFDRALAFVTQTGKLPLPCASAPGFVVNRILMPYMLEALAAHQEGHAIETIDAAARNFGMPMGPIELADSVGLDVALHVAEILAESFGLSAPDVLRDMVAAGRLGQKSAEGGFYTYREGRPLRRKDVAKPDQQLQDRLILMLVNEAAACFHDRIVDDADLPPSPEAQSTTRGNAVATTSSHGWKASKCSSGSDSGRIPHGPRYSPHSDARTTGSKPGYARLRAL
jgi:3-hydroxyacyl-CoA dehydrogenase/enoyl-CoA hydratase/3-hydroxybutyryl-CoA epimerase